MIERPVYFPCADDTLFGILSLPDHATDSLVLVAGGGGPNAATFQRNGVATRLARRLTETGLGVLRFDYHGVGDSTGEIGEFDLEKPLRRDVEAAASWARVEGFTRVGLLGICFGSRTALSVLDSGQKVSAFVLVTMPLADAVEVTQSLGISGVFRRLVRLSTWTRLADRSRRQSYVQLLKSLGSRVIPKRLKAPREQNAASRLRKAGSEDVPVLMLYGNEDASYLNARRSLDALSSNYPSIEVDATYAGRLHNFPTLPAQRAFVETVTAWLPSRMGVDATMSVGNPVTNGVHTNDRL